MTNQPQPTPAPHDGRSGREHDLIKTGDADSCRAIEDGHGEVVLAYCRVCWRGESELEKFCPGPRKEKP